MSEPQPKTASEMVAGAKGQVENLSGGQVTLSTEKRRRQPQERNYVHDNPFMRDSPRKGTTSGSFQYQEELYLRSGVL